MKITHRVPNQAPRITFTPGMRASMTAAAAVSSGPQAAILQRKNSGAQTPTVTAAQTTSVQQVRSIEKMHPVLQKKLILLKMHSFGY